MHILVLVVLLLSGCAGQQISVEKSLNDYALAAANQQDLSRYLSGAALRSAEQSQQLLRELGLRSYGSSRFSQTKAVSNTSFQSCLDVSGTSFRDLSGEQVLLERLERQLVMVEVTQGKISDLRLAGSPC